MRAVSYLSEIIKSFSLKLALCVIFFSVNIKLYAKHPELIFEKVIFEYRSFPQNISRICQDNFGFIWIASDNGLSRYDGYTFSDFRFSQADSFSISSNIVGSILYDSFGYLWVGTGDGLNRFDLKTEKFLRYYHNKNSNETIGDNLISPIYEDSKKNLWVGTYGGLSLFNREENTFTTYSHYDDDKTSISHNTVSSIFEDSKGNLWIGTWGGGLNLFDVSTGEFKHYKHDENNPNSLSHNFISFVIEDKRGKLWVGTRGGGLNEFDPEKGEFRHIKSYSGENSVLNDNILTSAYIDESGIFWIGTWNDGLILFDPVSEECSVYRYEPDNSNSLISDCITFIFKDKTGIVFIGTNKGISKARLKRSTFEFFSNKPGMNAEGLNSIDIRSIHRDKKGNIWLGTHEGGLNKMDFATGKISYFTFGLDQVPSKNKLEISGIIENNDGSFWINSIGHGLFKFYDDGRFLYYDRYSKSTVHSYNDYITFLFKDREGLLWLGFPNGVLSVVNPITDEISVFKLDSTIENKALLNEINYIVEDNNGNKWVAVRHKGLYRIDSKTKEVFHAFSDNKNDNRLSDNDVFVLHFSHDNILWIGTMKGLNRYDIQTGRIKHYFIENGLPDNAIRSITEDSEGNLWLGTHNGLSRLDIENERFNNYDERDGVYIKQFNSGSFFSEEENELFLCGYNGFLRFKPQDIIRDNEKPVINITGIDVFQQRVKIDQEIFGRVILNKSIIFTDTITLSHRQNNFAVYFTALHFKMPDKNQYAYKLEKYDSDWIYCGNERSVKYMNLSPGVYTFKVIGSNSDGIWNETGDSLTIIIRPPWWKTWWMFLVYSLSVVFCIVFYVRWKTAKHNKDKLLLETLIDQRTKEIASQNIILEQQAEELKESDEMRSRFYTYVSHEFRTPLTLIISPLSQVLSGLYTGNISELHKVMLINARRLLFLVDDLLDLAKLEKGRMELQLTFNKVNPLVNRALLVFKELADQKKIKLSFLQSDEDAKCFLDRDKLEKVLLNLLSNAFKFTPDGGAITVEVSSSNTEKNKEALFPGKFLDGWIRISVKDTGPGIDLEKQKKIFKHFYQENVNYKGWGVGLALVKELVSLHLGEVKLDSYPGKGSTFSVFLPLSAEVKDIVKSEVDDRDIQQRDSSSLHDAVSVMAGSQNYFASVSEENSQRSYSVLIVEDNNDIRQYISSLLTDKYKIIEAENGKLAWEYLTKTSIDIVISDIMMPQMDGFELCRLIKSNIDTCHIPVILLTAKTSEIDKIEGLEKGADDYLMKPFNPIELRKRVENLIELRQLLQKKYRNDMLLNPHEIETESLDEIFLDKIRQIVDREIASQELTVETIYKEMGFGRSTFHQKFKALTGYSANQFIRSYRLKRARQLIEQKAGNISQIAYEVGFTSTAYFTKCFKEEFGILPSDCN